MRLSENIPHLQLENPFCIKKTFKKNKGIQVN